MSRPHRTSVLVTAVLGLGALTALGSPADAASRCAGERATIVGTSGDDVLRGTRGRDVVVALGGDDEIRTLGGRDVVCAGQGKDLVVGGRGRDDLRGGPGVDRILAGTGGDLAIGGLGADVITSGGGADLLLLGPGDSARGEGGPDAAFLVGADDPAYVELGRGSDTFLAYAGRGEGQGGPGIDAVVLPFGPELQDDQDTAFGFIDLTQGRAGFTSSTTQMEAGLSQFENAFGSEVQDTLTGNEGENFLDGAAGPDLLEGLAGDDTLAGRGGRDTLDGGEDEDRCVDDGAATLRLNCEEPAAPMARTAHDARRPAAVEAWATQIGALGLPVG